MAMLQHGEAKKTRARLESRFFPISIPYASGEAGFRWCNDPSQQGKPQHGNC
jgi:hypothetical protein